MSTINLNTIPACFLLAVLALVLLRREKKESWKRLMVNHYFVVSNVGQWVLHSMNLGGFGLVFLLSVILAVSFSLAVDVNLPISVFFFQIVQFDCLMVVSP